MNGGLYRDLRIGDRVVLTEEGSKQGLQGRARTPFGVVVWVDPQRHLIKVRRDGIKGSGWYSPDFWECREDKTMSGEEEIVLNNQLVNAFIQGVEWWEWAIGDGGKLGPKNTQTARESALIRLREGTLGVDELTKVSIEHGDFGGCE